MGQEKASAFHRTGKRKCIPWGRSIPWDKKKQVHFTMQKELDRVIQQDKHRA